MKRAISVMNISLRLPTKVQLKNFAGINLGCFLFAFGVVVFRNPNNFASGGMSGLSLLISSFIYGTPVGAIMMVLNVFVLILGYIFLGKKGGTRSVYGTFALSGAIWLLEIFFPIYEPLTNSQFMELIYSVFTPGFGLAIVFHCGATTGGTDIIAQILSKHFKWKMAVSLLATDLLIALGAGFLFSTEAMLYSALGVFLRTFLMDSVMENLKTRKIVVVISDKSTQIQNFITTEIHRGATIHTAHGAYSQREIDVITTVVTRRQAIKLQAFIKYVDPAAFITISNSTEIIGQGFDAFS